MGRPSEHSEHKGWSGRFHLQELPLVDYDYDKGGAYWGSGSLKSGWMYRAYCDTFPDNPVDLFIRATSRDAAKAQVLATYPNAVFFK